MTTDTPSSRDEEIPLITAARNMDWQQVVLNGGPPCFHLCEDGRFCGRAQLWVGHDINHKFISLDDLLIRLSAEREKEGLVANRDVPTLFPTLQSEIKSLRATLAERDEELADERLNSGAQVACIQGLENELAEVKATWDEFINCNPNSPFATIEKLTAQLLAAQTVNGKILEKVSAASIESIALNIVKGIIAWDPTSGDDRALEDVILEYGLRQLAEDIAALSPDPTLLDEVKREKEELEVKYNELIMAVARKFPNETRHQTALKYICQAETVVLEDPPVCDPLRQSTRETEEKV